MRSTYASLESLKLAIGLSAEGRTHDAVLLEQSQSVSAAIDKYTGRFFYALTATRRYDGDGTPKLMLPGDVSSITTLSVDDDADRTWGLTLTEGSDYIPWPRNRNNAPIRQLDLNPSSSNLTNWPDLLEGVQIAGVFGYSNEVEPAGTLAAGIADAEATSLSLVGGHTVQIGDTIQIDTEDLYVPALTTDTATIERGVNGTTAAAHSNGAAVSRRRYPRDIEDATRMQCARLWREGRTGMSGTVGGDAVGWSFTNLYPAIRDILDRYRRFAGVY
jgi:hypothetical protein